MLLLAFLYIAFGIPILASGFAYILLHERLRRVAIATGALNVIAAWSSIGYSLTRSGSPIASNGGNLISKFLQAAIISTAITICLSILIRCALAATCKNKITTNSESNLDVFLKFTAALTLFLPPFAPIIALLFIGKRNVDARNAFKLAVLFHVCAILACCLAFLGFYLQFRIAKS